MTDDKISSPSKFSDYIDVIDAARIVTRGLLGIRAPFNNIRASNGSGRMLSAPCERKRNTAASSRSFNALTDS